MPVETAVTPPQLAARWHVSSEKILTWIANGELAALNVATRRGQRPRWIISPEAVDAFERARTAKPVTRQQRVHHAQPAGGKPWF
jgi:hypothetical protein